MDAASAAAAEVDDRAEQLVALSRAVHGDAEVAFEEHTSSRRVADALDAAGFDVVHGVAGLDTAVSATYGSGPLVVGVCAEYDALPGIGHACGHNVIASAGVGAALALARVADEVGLTVRLLGTPAEEAGGGKVLMMEGGAFDGLHAAMMVHPAPYETAGMHCLAVAHLEIGYAGVSAHASAYPELGRNAADALTVAQVGIGLLRQHLDPGTRVHGIVTDGGDAANVVPERTAGTWYARAQTLDDLAELWPRVRACFEAGALATGTELTVADSGPAYSQMHHDPDLQAAYARRAEGRGRTWTPFGPGERERKAGSTDMANVSLEIPSIHPMMAIETDSVNHQPGFTAACATPSADRAVLDGAVAMAQAAIDVARDDAVSARLRSRTFTGRDYRAPRFG